MTPDQFPNVFVALLQQSLGLGGSETEIFLSTIKTLDGQTMQTSDFSYLGEGVLSVDVQSASRVEFISFTGINASDVSVTGATRGLSFKSKSVITTNKKFHAVGAPVIIAFGTHNLIDLETIIINNQAAIEAQIAALTGIYLEINGGNAPTADIGWANHKIINLGNGTNPQDAVTFAQLASAVIGGGVAATTSQGGYVKVATLAEFLANTNTTVVGAFTFFNMATVSQVNSVGTAQFVYGQTITLNDYVFQATGAETGPLSPYTAGRVYKVDATNVANTGPYKGFALATANAGTTNAVQIANIVSGFSGLTPGVNIYINISVAGGITQTSGLTTGRAVGVAISATQIQITSMRKRDAAQALATNTGVVINQDGFIMGTTANATGSVTENGTVVVSWGATGNLPFCVAVRAGFLYEVNSSVGVTAAFYPLING